MQSFPSQQDSINGDLLSTMEIQQLIRQCQQGDAEALGALYQTYAQRMRGVCRRYISDEQAVDDVLHDAFVIIFTSFDRLRDPQKAEAWMLAIVRNVASKYKAHLATLSSVPIEEADVQSDTSSEPQDVRGIPLEDVMQMIDRLPEGYGRVFRLSVFEGMSHKEIASLLGIEPHSSSSQLARAKKMLRAMMKRYWVVLLLLLIPTAMLLLKKEKQIEKPVVVEQKKRQKPTEQIKAKPAQTPTIEPTSTGKQYVPAVLTLTPDFIAETPEVSQPADTLQPIIPMEEPADSASNRPNDEQPVKDSRPLPSIDDVLPRQLARSDAHRWSAELSYAYANGERNRLNEPFVYTPAPEIGDTQPTLPPIDNWSDYASYLANHPDEGSPAARAAMIKIALNNADKPGEDKIVRSTHHYQPATWSLAVRYMLDKRWAVETGLNFSRLTSDAEMGTNGNTISERQRIQYIGLPMKGIYQIFAGSCWSIYGSAGLTIEMPVSSKVSSHYFVNGQLDATDQTSLHAPWQLSTSVGLGLQYHLTPSIGLFAEPSLQYFLPTGSSIETYRTEHPLLFSLPVGIRFTW